MPWLKRSTPTDTGTRDLTATIPAMTAGTWTLRREGPRVYMDIYDARFTVASGTTLTLAGLLPVGFRPAAVPPYVNLAPAARVQPPSANPFTTSGGRVSRYGGVDLYDVAEKRVAIHAMWLTDDAWPTTLPGVKL